MALRKKFISEYTQTPNHILNLKDVSLKAKGLWTYINSKPEGWNFSVKGIGSQNKDGKDSVSSGCRELEKLGFLQRIVINENGVFQGYDYHLFDTIQTVDGLSANGISVDGLSDNGKPVNNSNTEGSNKDLSKPKKDLPAPKKEAKKTMFKNSAVFDFDIFKEKFTKEMDVMKIDIFYYWNVTSDWSETKDTKVLRTAKGWIATARTIMRRDNKENKLVLLTSKEVNSQGNKKAMEYLNL